MAAMDSRAWIFATVAPDSFGSEIKIALEALKTVSWVDTSRVVLAGTSEGETAVARYDGREFAARIVFARSCEDNFFVEAHGTRMIAEQPILNVISAVDPFFSPANPWLDNPEAKGHCTAAFSDGKQAAVVLVPGALLNMPQGRAFTRSFLEDMLKR